VSFRILLSDRAARDLDALNRDTQQRIVKRLEQIGEDPLSLRFSIQLKNAGGLRRSRVGGWRIIYSVYQERATVEVVTIERRGQVYKRL